MTFDWKAYAGISTAPAAWVIATQLGQILPSADCFRQISSLLVAVIAGGAVALAGVAASYVGQKNARDRTERFVGRLSTGVGLAFVFALVLQGAAMLLVNACQR